MLKKETFFKAFVTMICYILLTSFIFALFFVSTNNDAISYTCCYIVMILFLAKRHYKDLRDSLFSLKKDCHGYIKNIIIVCILFTILMLLANYSLYSIFHVIAKNEELARNSFFSSPLLMGINIVILAPIVEEMTYRYPYKNVKTHPLLMYICYSTLFALTHLASIATPVDLLYFIPYFLLSLMFGYGFYKTNNIYMSIILHILNNFINIMILLFI